MKLEGVTVAASVLSGILASACCIGPLVLALLGISGAAAAHELEPWRPYLLVLTYALLGGGFYFTYRREQASCGPGGSCLMPRANRLGKITLWLATVVVAIVTTFPWYSTYLF